MWCALSAGAYDFVDHEHGLWFNVIDNGTHASVTWNDYDDGTNYGSYSGSVTIPSEAQCGVLPSTATYYPVTEIGSNAFRSCTDLTNIIIPTTVKAIGSWAFSYCHSLTSVSIPNSVTSIGYNAFGDCNNLKYLIIGSGVEIIASYAFDSPLTYIRIYATNPPAITYQNVFKNSTYSDAVLIVPDGCVSAYKNATHWSNFAHIRNVNAVPINSTNFPDENFRSYLLTLYPDGFIPDIDQITSLNVAGQGISNMQGIELFTGLRELHCWNNSFTSLNLNSNTALTYLDCAPNTQLTSLSISNCTKLETIICYNTGITSLNLGNMSKLLSLSCHNTKLTTLSLVNKLELAYVNCSDCPWLTSVTVTGNSALTNFTTYNCSALKTLNCYGNNLSSLNLSGNTALTTLKCYSNPSLSNITNLSACTNLITLDCHECDFSFLNVSALTKLQTLSCYNNYLTSLNVSNNTSLKTLSCYYNQLVLLNVQGCSALETMSCVGNQLASLNLSGCTSLKELYCARNKITSSNMTALVNSLPMRSTSNPGALRVLNYTQNDEGNIFTTTHMSAAQAKYWNPKQWNGSSWVDVALAQNGDVDGNGVIGMDDLTALINYLVYGTTSGINMTGADVDGNGVVGMDDLTALINYLVYGHF